MPDFEARVVPLLITNEDVGRIGCPNCHDELDCLHIGAVKVVQHDNLATIDHRGVVSERITHEEGESLAGTSLRGSAVVVELWCENCMSNIAMVVYFHKGSVRAHMTYAPVDSEVEVWEPCDRPELWRD